VKTETLLIIALILAAGVYVYGQQQKQQAVAAVAPTPPDEPASGGVIVSAQIVDWAEKHGASDSTGDPELDALVNGYGLGDASGAATL